MNLPQIARGTIESYFRNEEFIVDELTKQRYSQKRACFVTLTKNNELRGCIGTLPFDVSEELWKNVQKNAINAAFHDSRFYPLKPEELSDIKIEVSILSEPKKLHDKKAHFLLNQITKDMGIILKKGHHSAIFLPQVWKEIPNKEKFLEHLSLKAGLKKEEWQSSELWCFFVDIESE